MKQIRIFCYLMMSALLGSSGVAFAHVACANLDDESLKWDFPCVVTDDNKTWSGTILPEPDSGRDGEIGTWRLKFGSVKRAYFDPGNMECAHFTAAALVVNCVIHDGIRQHTRLTVDLPKFTFAIPLSPNGGFGGTYPPVDYFTDGASYPVNAAEAKAMPPYWSMFETDYWAPIAEAFEIIDLGEVEADPTSETALLAAYFGSGSNPVSADVWDSENPVYEPPSPYSKNTTRNLQFNSSYFIGSSDSSGTTVGTTSYITTSDSYTWGLMSTVHNAMTPFDTTLYPSCGTTDEGVNMPCANAYMAGALVTTPPAGSVKLTVNYKAQNMQFYAYTDNNPTQAALLRFFVKDNYGNVYIMHASGTSDAETTAAEFDAAVLPEGWKKYSGPLPHNLVLTPSIGSPPVGSNDSLYEYNLLRDNEDLTYHQVFWGSDGVPAGDVIGPMEIWGGNTSDTLVGAPDHPIYAGAGNDTINNLKGSHSIIDGGTGVDTCVYPENYSLYQIEELDDGRVQITKPSGSIDILIAVENLNFNDQNVVIGKSAADTFVESSATTLLKTLAESSSWQ